MKKTFLPLISDDAAAQLWRKQLLLASSAGSAVSVCLLTVMALTLCPSLYQETERLAVWVGTAVIGIVGATYVCWLSTKSTISAMQHRMRSIRSFLQDAGHELRTPVAMLKSRVQLMERQFDSEPEVTVHLEALTESIGRLIVLIDDMRTLARAEALRGTSDLSLININKLVKSSAEQIKAACDSREMTINVTVQAPATVIGDADAIDRVISNLLSNAVRYGKNGGTIEIRVETHKHHIVLTVQDDGIGVSEEALPKIFDRFFREERTEISIEQGSGLGLAIVKAIVESHSGKIDVESEENKFTRFTIELPKSPVHPLMRIMNSKV